MSQDLSDIRRQIDEVDSQILSLLAKRTELAVEVGRLRGNASQDIVREEAVTNRLIADNESDALSNQAITAIWQVIFAKSRQAQANSVDTIES